MYYLSMEFLMGRSLLNTLYNLGIKDPYAEALTELGYDLEVIADMVRGSWGCICERGCGQHTPHSVLLLFLLTHANWSLHVWPCGQYILVQG